MNQQQSDLLEQIRKKKYELTLELQKVRSFDKFWFYEPSKTGALSPEALAFAQKWLLPEDCPTVWTGMDQAIQSEKGIVGVFGGNQAGKTVLNAVLAHIKITGEIPVSMKGLFPESKLPKGDITFGRVYGLSAAVIEEVLVPKFKEWMPKKYFHKEGWERTYNKQEKILRYYRDGEKFIGQIKFVSCEQDVEKTQGPTLAFIHFDEEPPHAFFEEALPRFTTTKMDIMFFMTPTNGMSWTFDALVDNPDTNVECFKVSTLTNKYINFDSVDASMRQQDSYEKRKMRLLGEFVSLSGLIYSGESAFNKAVHLIKPFKLNWDEHIIYRGMDNHISKETCVVEVAVLPNRKRIVVGVYWKKGDTEQIKEDLAKRAAERKYRLAWTRYDKSLDYEMKILGDVNIVDLLKRPPNPIPAMFPSEKYKGSIDAGVDLIKRDLKDGNLLFFDTPEVWQVIKDIQSLEREKGTNEEKKGTRDKISEGKKDRHASLRYVYQGNPQFIPIENDVVEPYFEERFI